MREDQKMDPNNADREHSKSGTYSGSGDGCASDDIAGSDIGVAETRCSYRARDAFGGNFARRADAAKRKSDDLRAMIRDSKRQRTRKLDTDASDEGDDECEDEDEDDDARRQRRGGREDKMKLSKGMKNIEFVQQPVATEEDKDDQIERDTDHLTWLPVPSCPTQTAESCLGPLVAGERCFGCEVGSPAAGGGMTPYADGMSTMRKMYADGSPYMRLDVLCFQLAKFFEAGVRGPCNDILAARNCPTTDEIPPWSPRCIYEHFTSHITETGALIARRLHMIDDLISFETRGGLYRQNRMVPSERKTSHKSWAMIRQAMDMELKLLRLQPSQLLFYDDGRTSAPLGSRSQFARHSADLTRGGKRPRSRSVRRHSEYDERSRSRTPSMANIFPLVL
jgi:hypothetical protein